MPRPTNWPNPVLVSALVIICSTFTQAYQADGPIPNSIWRGILESSEDLPDFRSSPDFLAPFLADDVTAQLERDAGGEADVTGFPELTAKQRKFAVNPSYRSYYDPRYRKVEGISNRDAAVNTDEVVADPFESEDLDKAKKAMINAESLRSRGPVSSEAIENSRLSDIYFMTIVAAGSAMAVFALIGAGFCYHRVRRNSKASEDVEYPAYGVTGPGKEYSPTSGTDRKLAQNAQMYHYQHQKQQMIAFDSANGGSGRRGGGGRDGNASDAESEDGEEGDYTVYECPGLAPTGEMEVHNPLFQDEQTPKSK